VTTLTLNIDELRQRKEQGTSIKDLAKEAGVSWQKLWGMLTVAPQPSSTSPRPVEEIPQEARHVTPVLQVNAAAGDLVDKYRPQTLAGIWGQDRVVTVLRKFAASPTSTPFLFEGESGTGKTSAALALAAELGCDITQGEFGGVYQIASGEQTADTVRKVAETLHNFPFYGSGWKVLIVNEADRMSLPAETIWLDRLEHLPPQTVVIFTTNYASRLPGRMLDRCRRVKFSHKASKLRSAAESYSAAIWKSETGQEPTAEQVEAIVAKSVWSEEISLRRVVREIANVLDGGTEGDE